MNKIIVGIAALAAVGIGVGIYALNKRAKQHKQAGEEVIKDIHRKNEILTKQNQEIYESSDRIDELEKVTMEKINQNHEMLNDMIQRAKSILTEIAPQAREAFDKQHEDNQQQLHDMQQQLNELIN